MPLVPPGPRWRVVSGAARTVVGRFAQSSQRFSGMAVEVHGAAKDDGARVVQYRDWGSANQQRQLVPAKGASPPATGSAGGTTAALINKTIPYHKSGGAALK